MIKVMKGLLAKRSPGGATGPEALLANTVILRSNMCALRQKLQLNERFGEHTPMTGTNLDSGAADSKD